MKVIASITLREMTEDERPDEVGPTGVTANFDAMKAGAFARSGFLCAEFRKALSRDSGLAVVALLRTGVRGFLVVDFAAFCNAVPRRLGLSG